ncbi:substrate-binding domain-containing protein [Beijerinckia sp. L45]|uniref:molybdate ABC transporter substrate-binding protein n=1 Tax=Beijerinckia sp. L45 TaxID=1641855 RepID=UPI00131E2D6F|nr:substrate-binding domain-containing protein [Beijerinckia sp. L45]
MIGVALKHALPFALAVGVVAIGILRPAAGHAAELELLSSVALKAPLTELLPAFEKASGTTVHATFDSAGAVKHRIESGDAFCVGILFTSAVDSLVKTGAMTDASRLAHIGIGLAYRKQDARPAAATLEDFKATLLAAKSIAVSDPALGGVSSAYYKTTIDQLGLALQLAAKTILTRPGEGAKPVAAGQADLGIVTMSEIATLPGLDAVPLFPADPKTQAAFSVGLSSACKEPEVAKRFIASLRTPQAAAIFKAKNIDPD